MAERPRWPYGGPHEREPQPGSVPKQQAKQKHPPDWQPDLNPDHLAGQNIGQVSDERVNAEWSAFHLRKRGLDLGGVNVHGPYTLLPKRR
jgi:hypothetical protein